MDFVFTWSLALIPPLILCNLGYYLPPMYDVDRLMSEYKYLNFSTAFLSFAIFRGLEVDERALIEAIIRTFQKESDSKDEFIRSFSHDLRTPLNGILASIELLIMDKKQSKEQQENLDVLKYCSKVLRLLVENVLSHGEKHMKGVPKRTNTKEFFETAAGMLKSFCFEKKVSFEMDVKEVPDTIKIDRTALSQVLLNLGANGIKFSKEENAKLRLRARCEKKVDLVCEVIDNGVGISKKFSSTNLFKPYKREGVVVSGSGLGLSISKRIAEEKLKGSLEYAPNHDEGGCIFTVRCPIEILREEEEEEKLMDVMEVEKEKEEGDVKNEETEENIPGKQAQAVLEVLIVDDSKVNRQVMKKLLDKTSRKLDVHTAQEGASAIEFVARRAKEKRANPLLVLLDLQMPVSYLVHLVWLAFMCLFILFVCVLFLICNINSLGGSSFIIHF